MKIGFIGLGRMGKNMILNLLEKGYTPVTYDKSLQAIKKIKRKRLYTAYSIKELVEKLPRQKIIWVMIPAGKPVDKVIKQLLPHLKKGGIIIDGGNSYYKDSIRRYEILRKKGIYFLDVGTSGGISGARYGASMMIGGNYKIFKKLEFLFRDMSVKNGYGYMGKTGAGHFVKMVHNGIEYGMMGAIGEGMETIKKHSQRFKTDLKEVARVYAHGSIIESRLVSWLLAGMLDPNFKSISGEVPRGETEEEMKKLEKLAKMPILHQARLMRVRTRKKPSFMGKIISTLRNQFGGHAVKK